MDDQIISVRRQWNDVMRIAQYRLSELSNIHWSTVSGGVNAPTNRPYLHAYVQCDAMISGELAHSGTHGQCPHRIKVCIVAKDNDKQLIQRLKEAAQ